MDKAIIKADFADYRRIKSRKVFQLFIEVALEREKEVLMVLGFPDTSTGTPVAIARLATSVAEQSSSGVSRLPNDSGPSSSVKAGETDQSSTATKGEETADKPSISFREKPRSVQAALMCRNRDFCKWLTYHDKYQEAVRAYDFTKEPTDEEVANTTIKLILMIDSKKELDRFADRGEAWDKLLASYDFRDQVR